MAKRRRLTILQRALAREAGREAAREVVKALMSAEYRELSHAVASAAVAEALRVLDRERERDRYKVDFERGEFAGAVGGVRVERPFGNPVHEQVRRAAEEDAIRDRVDADQRARDKERDF